MMKLLSENYQRIYQLNIDLLNMSKQGQWDEFIELAEDYITTLNDFISNQSVALPESEKENFSVFLQNLIANEDEITRVLKKRLEVLGKDITTLHNGRKVNQVYVSQSLASFH